MEASRTNRHGGRVSAGRSRHTRPTAPPRWSGALRGLLAGSFWALDRARFQVRLHGLESFTNRPATLVVSNHKSDSDVLLLAPALYRAFRGRGAVGRIAFVAAEQMFQPGYVSAYLLSRPRWLRRLLHPANLSAALQALRAYPVPRSGRRLLAACLHEVLTEVGDLRLDRVFRTDPARLFPGLGSGDHISDALRWRHQRSAWQYQPLSVFRPEIARRLRKRCVEEIHACLDCFTTILDRGESVFIAPEGSLSDDGRFGGVRAGLGRLVRRTDRPLTLLPINVTYDPMAPGRTWAFISMGRELRAGTDWSADDVDRVVERAIRALTTVTLPQLIAPHLLSRGDASGAELSEAQLRRALFQSARSLAGQGFLVDPRLLTADAFERRWRRLIRHARRRRLLTLDGSRLRSPGLSADYEDNGRPTGTEAPAVWAYYANELDSVLGRSPRRGSHPDASEDDSRCQTSNPASISVERSSGKTW